MSKYYVKSIAYNVLGVELDVTLCEYEGKLEFRQPHFERAWTIVTFKNQFAALNTVQKMHPLATLALFEDTGKILTKPNASPEYWLTSMVIKEYNNE